MAQHEVAQRLEPVVKRLVDAPAGGVIEVYQHIATEDGIDSSDHCNPRFIQQVEMTEVTLRTDRIMDQTAFRRVHEVSFVFRWHRTKARIAIHAPTCHL